MEAAIASGVSSGWQQKASQSSGFANSCTQRISSASPLPSKVTAPGSGACRCRDVAVVPQTGTSLTGSHRERGWAIGQAVTAVASLR